MSIDIQSAQSVQDVQPAQQTETENIKKGTNDIAAANAYNKEEEIKAAEEVAEAEEAQKVQKALTEEEFMKVAQQLQEFVESLSRNVRFSIDKDSGRDVISVVEVNTGELIRQIPSEEVLKLASSLSKAAGLIVQEKV